jgi:hypothetical protein
MRRTRPLWRGVVEARRAWTPAGPQARERLLAQWTAGTVIRRARELPLEVGGYVVDWAAPQRIDTRSSPLLPLLPHEGRYTTAPLHKSDLSSAPEGSIVILWHGRLLCLPQDALVVEDPCTWLQLGPFAAVQVHPLGDPPPPLPLPAQNTSDLHAVFGMKPGQSLTLPAPKPESGLGTQAGRVAGRAAAAVGRMLQAAPVPRWMSRQGSWLERWGERLGLTGALSAMFGMQHAQYLRDLMLRFDDGDWLGGIQQAIPLGKGGTGRPRQGPALDWLRARQDLGFGVPTGEEGRSVELAGDLFDKLAQLYRRAHQALDQAGRRREAAYVLSELLGEIEPALEYLEKHREFRLAAELAGAKGLDPSRLVALWLQAREPERAIAIARLYGAWGAALTLLQRKGDSQLTEWLQLEWAEHQAQAGRYASAVELAWKIPAARARAAQWLREAVRGGGISGAEALGRALELSPDKLDAWEEPLRALLSDRSPEAPLCRAAFARSLPQTPSARRFAQALSRQLVRDSARAPGIPTLVRRVAAGALLEDLPALPEPAKATPLSMRSETLLWDARAADTGQLPALDAVTLPGNRTLVALGELGARLLSAEGKELCTVAHPTHRLVSSPDGRRVLLLGRRGAGWSIARLDPVTRSLSRPRPLELDAFCDSFDGELWFVVHRGQLLALDVYAEDLRALWGTELGLQDPSAHDLAVRLHASPAVLHLAVDQGQDLAWSSWALPGLQQQRRPARPLDGYTLWAATEQGLLLAWALGGRLCWLDHTLHRQELPFEGQLCAAAATGRYAALASVLPDQVQVALWNRTGHKPCAQVRLWGATRASVRFVGPLLVLCDDLGRVRSLEPEAGELRLDLRV